LVQNPYTLTTAPCPLLDTFASGLIQAVRAKTAGHGFAHGFAREFLWSGKRYEPTQKTWQVL